MSPSEALHLNRGRGEAPTVLYPTAQLLILVRAPGVDLMGIVIGILGLQCGVKLVRFGAALL